MLAAAAPRRRLPGRRTAAALAAVALPAAAASLALAYGAKDATLLISVSSAEVKGTALSQNASVSADGRYIAFESDAQLHADDADAVSDIYVRDTIDGTTTLVSRATGIAGAKGTADSTVPAITPDGRYVAMADA